jgi:hypothetical protein
MAQLRPKRTIFFLYHIPPDHHRLQNTKLCQEDRNLGREFARYRSPRDNGATCQYPPAPDVPHSKIQEEIIRQLTIYHDIQELNDCNADGYAYTRALFGPKGKLLTKHQSDKQKYRGPWGKN